MATTNKDQIITKAKEEELVLGCWDNSLESLTQKELNKVLDNLKYATDTDVMIKRKLHVVEIDIVDNEVDFSVLTKSEYISRYGSERWED